MTSEIDSNKILKVYNAITNRISSLIGSHNNNSSAHSFGNAGASKNVVTDANGNLTVENKPTIPTDVSDLTDTNNTTFTPKSHSHGLTDVTDTSTVEVVVTYTDSSTDTLNLVVYDED